MKGFFDGSRSGFYRRCLRFGGIFACLFCLTGQVYSQALPSPTGGVSIAPSAGNFSWIRSVQSLGNGGTAVRYIAANSISAPAGATSYALRARGVTPVLGAAFRSPAALSAIRTVCAERRACLVALAVGGALGTIGVLAQIGSDGLPEPALLDSSGVATSMINYPQASFSPGDPPVMVKNTEGNGVTALSISQTEHIEANKWAFTGTWNSSTQTYGTNQYTIWLEGLYETPTETYGAKWNHFGWNDNCTEFVKYSGTYVYPDAWCSPSTRIVCNSNKPCFPKTTSPLYVESELELGNIIMNPGLLTITNDQARRVMEQTNMQPAFLGESNVGRSVYMSIMDIPALSPGSYASPQEIIDEGLDRWGATDPAGNPIGNPLPGWDPSFNEGLNDTQPSPGYTSDPSVDPELDPETSTGGNNGGSGNIPQPPYDTRVINIDDSIPDDNAVVPESNISVPGFLDYGSRWLPNSCPAPQTIDIGVAAIPFDFDATCLGLDFMSYLLVASALIGAGSMVLRSALA